MFWLIKCDFFCLFHTERSWHAYWFSAVIGPGNIVDFWNSDFLKKSQLDLPSAWIFFLYLLLCMNFFSWHFPFHEFFFCFFPHPPHHFSNGPSLKYLSSTLRHTCLCEFVPKKNVSFITEPQDDFFCFIPPSLAAKHEFKYIGIGLLWDLGGGGY